MGGLAFCACDAGPAACRFYDAFSCLRLRHALGSETALAEMRRAAWGETCEIMFVRGCGVEVGIVECARCGVGISDHV